jgi:hypothetical protein
MKVSLRDKVYIYENFLKRIATIDVEKECEEALKHPDNDPLYKYPFAFGMIGRQLKSVVSDAQYTLSQGTKK